MANVFFLFFPEASSALSIGKRIDSKALYKNSELEAIDLFSGRQDFSVREIWNVCRLAVRSVFVPRESAMIFGKIFLDVC